MAKEVKPEVEETPAKPEVKAKSGFKFFRNPKHAGAKFVVNNAEHDPLNPRTVEYERFTPYREKDDNGDWGEVGYLKTKNKVVVERCTATPYIEEITEKEFKEATDTERAKRPAIRARL